MKLIKPMLLSLAILVIMCIFTLGCIIMINLFVTGHYYIAGVILFLILEITLTSALYEN